MTSKSSALPSIVPTLYIYKLRYVPEKNLARFPRRSSNPSLLKSTAANKVEGPSSLEARSSIN